jgi:anti-anti-sigma regulatory factor
MTLKIELQQSDGRSILRLIGRIGAEHLEELKAQITAATPPVALDLTEVVILDVDAVRFLVSAERQGIEVSNSSPYIREWMNRIRGSKF